MMDIDEQVACLRFRQVKLPRRAWERFMRVASIGDLVLYSFLFMIWIIVYISIGFKCLLCYLMSNDVD